MTSKEYLSQYRLLDTEINSKLEQVEQLREKAMSISYISGGSGGTNSDKIGRTVAKLVDAESEINRDIERLLSLKKEIEEVISKVGDPVLEKLLVMRYINGLTFERIAVEMHYSYMHICRLHGKALKKVEDVIECYITSVVLL